MKKILVVLSFCTLVCGNLFVTNLLPNDNSNFLFNTENVAYAQGEGGGGSFTCYSWMVYELDSRVLECNTPCCYKDDYKPNNSNVTGGTCTGTFEDCN